LGGVEGLRRVGQLLAVCVGGGGSVVGGGW